MKKAKYRVNYVKKLSSEREIQANSWSMEQLQKIMKLKLLKYIVEGWKYKNYTYRILESTLFTKLGATSVLSL